MLQIQDGVQVGCQNPSDNHNLHIKRALSELLATNTCVNNRNPNNKFSVSSHELCEHSFSYIRVLILRSSNALNAFFCIIFRNYSFSVT